MKYTLIIFLIFYSNIYAQVGVNTVVIDNSAILQIEPKNNSAGFLMTRMSSSERSAISSPANGLMVYDITVNDIYLLKYI